MKPDELRDAFRERIPALEAFGQWVTDRVVSVVEKHLGDQYSPYFFRIPPKPRVKDLEGFVEKSTRKGKTYADPLSQITDQVGTRFVVLLDEERQLVSEAIRAIPEWKAVKAKDIEEIRLGNPHHFDYVSDHWTVSLIEPLRIGELVISPDLTCEIQVRTLLQHAYAELAHSATYKPKVAADASVIRIIARGAALIETTDCVFREVAEKLRSATVAQDQALALAAKWYSENVGKVDYPLSAISQRIVDAYSEHFAATGIEEIEEFLKARPWLATVVRDNLAKPLFSDPVIVLVFWLVHELRRDIYSQWPYDTSLLQIVFTKLGIASD